MNLFDILSNDERVIVYSDKSEGIIITWNRSLTLQCWRRPWDHSCGGRDTEDVWNEVEAQTLSEEPGGYRSARKAAKAWYANMGD